MNIPKFAITEITDQYLRKNFERLRDFLTRESPLLGFRHFELQFTRPEDPFRLKHGLGFAPRDVIITSQDGTGTVEFQTPLATADFIEITVTGAVTQQTPLTIRFLMGAYQSPGG